MKIRYTPFSERMVIDQPVKGMDFANDMIQTYFMMSLRYRECYYKQRPQGNTVYFMNYPEASLLFYFAAGMRSYRVNGFRIEKEERRKAWIYMLPLIQSLRAYDFGRKEGTKQLEEDCHFISFFPLYRRNVFLFVRRSGFLIVVQLNMLKKIIYW